MLKDEPELQLILFLYVAWDIIGTAMRIYK